jgi:hypothetical protein
VSSANHLWLVIPRESPTGKMNPQNIDVLDQLRQLGALRDEHVLTHEEYEVKKTELRAQLSTS